MVKTYILDTNIILDDLNNIFKIYNNENILILPSITLDELDTKKTNFDELGYRSREFGRFLDECEIQVISNPSLLDFVKQELTDNLRLSKLTTKSNNITLYVADLKEFESDTKYRNTTILNDRKIIEICQYFKDSILISFDVMCRLKALSENIEAETLKGSSQDTQYQFIKELSLKDYIDLDGTKVYDFDKDYQPENFNYIIKFDNGKTDIYQVFNDTLYKLDENNINKQDIKPLNLGQKLFVGSVISDFTNIIISNAPAGSGKSLLAISTAMRLIKEKKFNKIVYIRNSIESIDKGEDIGYLPGLEEKFAIYNHPLYDNLKFIAKQQLTQANHNKSNKDQISEDLIDKRAEELQERYNITTMWIGELRGRTISDAVVIIDEVQNFSKSSLRTSISRLDKGCKLIVIGSNNQIDNPYINKYTNGLSVLFNATKEKHPEVKLHATTMDKIVRGGITAFAERVFNSK